MRKIIEKEFIYKGIACYITLDDQGIRCGYAALPQDDYIKCGIDTLQCHGGITYIGKRLPGIDAADGDMFFIGFDCAHWGDRMDIEEAKKVFGIGVRGFGLEVGEVRTVEFCEKELIRLVDQIRK